MKFTSAHADRLEIHIRAGKINLAADLSVPDGATGLVLFVHGGRRSRGNRHIADALNRGLIATVMADVLTEDEESAEACAGQARCDIARLVDRVTAITDWIGGKENLNKLGLGYFGASTAVAAALAVAAERSHAVRAVVSRGGRPDLAGPALVRVLAPCLFIVGANDAVVARLNQQAIAQLPPRTDWRLAKVPGAAHLEEPEALDRVAHLAQNWFQQYLNTTIAAAPSRPTAHAPTRNSAARTT